jgi:hypothetical protein
MLPATPAATEVPHQGMGAARTNGEHAVTGRQLQYHDYLAT